MRDRGDWEIHGTDPDCRLSYWSPEGRLDFKGNRDSCNDVLRDWQMRYEHGLAVSKDSVTIIDNEPIGLKYDDGKPEMDLLPPDALIEISKVLSFGARKYSAGNFAHGIHYSRLIAAAMRHISSFNAGEDKDPESNLSHVAHAACCLMFLLHMEKNKPEMDNRWIKQITKK